MATTAYTAQLTISAVSRISKNTALPTPAGATGLITGSNPTDQITVNDTFALSFGNGSGQANNHFHGIWTIPNGGRITIDLSGGAETDIFGDLVVATEVKAIYVHNRSTTVAELIHVGGNVGGVALLWCATAGDEAIIGPSGSFLVTSPIDGWPVAAAANDQLEISNPGGVDIDADVLIVFEE